MTTRRKDAPRTDELPEWTASGVAAAVTAGSFSAADAARTAIERIATRDGALAAFQVVRRAAAMREAAQVDARVAAGEQLPLAGVPVAIKDNVPVEGEPMRIGSAATEAHPQPADHEVVRRLREAGAVVVGITRVPELCAFGTTDSVYGVTRNPWAPSRTPGGSSGGSAAAVAAGIVPVAHAADGMGSIRIPAACCGLVGLKPGRGVVPAHLGDTDWYGLAENGPLATTVRDAALVLSVMAGDPAYARVTDAADGPTLTIGVASRPPLPGLTVDREHLRAVFASAGLLRHAGHSIERFDPVVPNAVAIGGFARWFAGVADDAAHLEPALLEKRTRTHAALGRQAIERGLLAEGPVDTWREQMVATLTTYDLLMSPVLAQPPIEATRWGDRSWAANVAGAVRSAPFAAAWNIAGFPAMSVPAGIHPGTGTPLSVQLVARPGRESMLLSVAATLEKLRPWRRVAPAYS